MGICGHSRTAPAPLLYLFIFRAHRWIRFEHFHGLHVEDSKPQSALSTTPVSLRHADYRQNALLRCPCDLCGCFASDLGRGHCRSGSCASDALLCCHRLRLGAVQVCWPRRRYVHLCKAASQRHAHCMWFVLNCPGMGDRGPRRCARYRESHDRAGTPRT